MTTTDRFTDQDGAVWSMAGATCPRCQHPASLTDRSGAAGYFTCPECRLVFDEPDFSQDAFLTAVDN